MRLFYLVATALFAYASYEIFTDGVAQPFVSAALGLGLGWFATSLFNGD
jgi:hypothetical protein